MPGGVSSSRGQALDLKGEHLVDAGLNFGTIRRMAIPFPSFFALLVGAPK